ncbi:hypothetical protein [Palleronia caenipelagi]|uniref:Uncharacterized protein n=1 Tax=Palleronia caenipelagi TaxID=2489174 RepID=A0A547PUF7_9RHOB|nr:hypothetical protein [Palleronia caenipelagi]TRD17782.1 hypothetical protein FEV53_12480 [Palleronia caenipelagi]
MSAVQGKAVHATGGFLLMGGWAAFANGAHPMPAPLVAGLVQGALTAGITLFLKQVIERLFRRVSGPAQYLLPPLAAFSISLTLLTVAHSLAGTPAFWTTLSVPLMISTTYAVIYTVILKRHA